MYFNMKNIDKDDHQNTYQYKFRMHQEMKYRCKRIWKNTEE